MSGQREATEALRVYRPYSQVSHILAGDTYTTLCGLESMFSEWLGLRGYAERAAARGMPPCKRCDAVAVRAALLGES